MLPIRCRGCLTNLENENNGKDIFKDDLAIDTVNLEDQSQSTLNLNKRIKLDSCIELITGKEITETDNLPRVLCATCLKKLEACIQFRFQLLTSLEILITSVSHDDAFNPTLACDVNDDSSLASKAFDAEIKGKSQEKGTDVLQSVSENICKGIDSKQILDDLINVDENSASVDFNVILNEEADAVDVTNCNKHRNDKENNNLIESESSNDSINLQCSIEKRTKIQDNDIESEIDVCSGEDDEVLELDIQSRKNETIVLESSSESDIEVCDYEPTGKKIRSYKTLTQPIFF